MTGAERRRRAEQGLNDALRALGILEAARDRADATPEGRRGLTGQGGSRKVRDKGD
jgi:hypothetical protein